MTNRSGRTPSFSANRNYKRLIYRRLIVKSYGLEKSKLCIIITDKGEELSKTLVENSPRGVTMIEGRGMYTGNDHNVVFTCVKNRQLTQLKQIVKSVDEKAFIIINESVEVRGQGFQRLDE